MKKNILITGTSTGVGLESAILFAKNNFKVYASMRNLAKAEALKKAIEADPLEQSTQEEIDWVTNVNYTGVVRTTKAVLPFMREARAGHVVNITSIGGLVGQPFNELYCAAKFAVEGFTEALATYVSAPFNINFSMVEPGGIATEFMTNAVSKMSNANGEMVSGEYAPIFEKYLSGAQNRANTGEEQLYQTGKEVAEVVLKVVLSENPPLRIRTSKWAENLAHLKTQADPDGTKLVNQVKEYFL